jgi:hypothetical protein
MKEKQYEASSSVVRNKNDTSKRRCVSLLSYNNSKNLYYCQILFPPSCFLPCRIFYSLFRRGAKRNIMHSIYIINCNILFYARCSCQPVTRMTLLETYDFRTATATNTIDH